MTKSHQQFFPDLFHTVTPPDPAADSEAGGGSTPDATDSSTGGDQGPTQEDIKKLQEALRKERDRAVQFERRLKAIDPQQVDDARREAEEARKIAEEAERTASTKINAIQQRTQKELQEAREQAAKAVEDARRLKVRLRWETEFVASGGFTEVSEIDGVSSFDLIWNQIGHTFEEDEQGFYLKGPDGLAMIDPETGKRVTPRQHFERLKNDRLYSAHFQPIGGSGGGSGAGVRGRVDTSRDLGKVPTGQLFTESFGASRRLTA